MKRRSLFVSLLAFLALAAPASAQTWTSLGPAAGNVSQVFLAPSLPSTMLVPVGDDQGGIFKTTNSGATWQSISVGLCDIHVNAVAFHPTDANTIYVGTISGGVCATTNGGATWTQLKTGLPVDVNGFPTKVDALAVNPATPTTLLAGTQNGVYVSTNSGGNWTAAGMAGLRVESIVISPSTPATAYAVGSAVFKSTDSGASWTAMSTGLPGSLEDGRLSIDPANANDVYLVADTIYKTTSGGTGWAPANTGIGSAFFLGNVVIDPTNTNTLYVSAIGGCGVCKSTDGGGSWSAVGATGLPGVFGVANATEGMAIDPTTPTHLFAGTPEGVYRSNDSGLTWTAINTNLSNVSIRALAVTGGTPRSVLASHDTTADSAALIGLPGGMLPFSALISPLVADDSGHIVAITVDPADANIIYVVGGKVAGSGSDCPQLHKTTNGGTVWTALLTNAATSGVPTGTCFGSLTMDPTTSTTLYLAVTYGSGGPIPIGIYKSINGGVNWTAASTGIANAVSHIAVSALNNSIVYASTGGAVYRSANGGGTWANVSSGLPLVSASVGRLVLDPANDAIVYAATPRGVYVTTNSGGAWTARTGGWPTIGGVLYSARALTIDPNTPTTLYASPASPSPGPSNFLSGVALGTGLMKSTDSGVTWVSAGAELAGVAVRDVAIDGTTLFAATNNGVFRFGATLPTVTIDKAALAFSAVTTGAAFVTKTSTQAIRISQTGTGTVSWTASSVSPWLVVSPSAGSGSATLSISVQFAAGLAASQSGAITLTFTGASNSAGPVSVTLNTLTSTAAAAPQGSFDTPIDGSTGINGSIAVTGWAVDDIEVTRVRVLRDPVPGEPAGALVFIGDAVLVEGARPDIETIFPALPRASRAGWGYLMLTNFLPGLGNGTFKLYAFADDADGNSTSLGSKIITCDNGSATTPFGAIDTPAQGETVTTASLNNFGWVLSPGSRKASPPDGGTVRVVIDGALGVTPAGWTSRGDLSALFPVADFSGIGNALGVATLDMTALANGVHTIAWLVTDNLGAASGIGSRYFSVANGSITLTSTLGPGMRGRSLAIGSNQTMTRPSAALRTTPVDTTAIPARRGYGSETPLQPYATRDGRTTVQSEELDRIELHLGGSAFGAAGDTYAGYLRVGERLSALPAGSSLNAETGEFTWQPGVAFVGVYDLVFARLAGGEPVARREVRVVLNPKSSNRVGPQTVIDVANGRVVAGWAADLDSQVDTGVDTLHVWAYPEDGRDPIFVGAVEYGGSRPDVAAVYGDRFLKSGYGIRIEGLAPGAYDLAVFAYSTVTGRFAAAKTARVTIR